MRRLRETEANRRGVEAVERPLHVHSYQVTDRQGRAVGPVRIDGAAGEEDALLLACDDLHLKGAGHEVRRSDGMILLLCPKYAESRAYYAKVKATNRQVNQREYA